MWRWHMRRTTQTQQPHRLFQLQTQPPAALLPSRGFRRRALRLRLQLEEAMEAGAVALGGLRLQVHLPLHRERQPLAEAGLSAVEGEVPCCGGVWQTRIRI